MVPLCLFLGAFLSGVGLTILLLARLGKDSDFSDPVRDRVEGCLTFVFGGMPILLGLLLLVGAALAIP
jgi:hypothetical protein